MGVFGSGKLHNYGSESENKLTVTVFDELEFSVTVEKGYCLFSSPNVYNFLDTIEGTGFIKLHNIINGISKQS